MFLLGSPEPPMLAVHSGEHTDITTAANSSCCFYLLSLCWHRLAGTQRACNCPSPALWPQRSVRSYKSCHFSNSVSIGGKASHAARMMRGSHSQSYWGVRRTERVKDRTFFNSKNNAEEIIGGSKYTGGSLILYHIVYYALYLNR